MRILVHPADIGGDHGLAAGQRLEHAHRAALIQGRDQDIVQIIVEIRHLAVADEGGRPRPALAGKAPFDARYIHHVGNQCLALAAGMIGPPDDADPHFRRERVEIDTRRDRGHILDAGLGQFLGIAPGHADRMLDIGGDVEIALAGIRVVFRMREEGDLDRPGASVAAGIIDVIVQVGRRVGLGAIGHRIRPHGDLPGQLLQNPAPIGDRDVRAK